MKCNRCKVNMAVVFVSKIEDNGKRSSEALCLKCAKELNIAPINEVFEKTGIFDEDVDDLNKKLEELAGKDFLFSEDGDQFNCLSEFEDESDGGTDNSDNILSRAIETITERKKKSKKKFKYLGKYTVNITDKAADKLIDPVIGRDKEIDRLLQILNRRVKNNPVLLGEPGVGKTAVVEGVALRIAEGRVPARMLGVELHMLDLTSVIAGTQFRGQFEARMKGLLDEIAAQENIILVIDELHTIVGSGEGEAGMSAATILKPVLVNGEIKVIGTTTFNEYRKYIEKSQALARRFQPVIINEPTPEQTVEIIKGLRTHYENFHHIKITDKIIEAAVELSDRFIADRFMPDKAIDLIDEAGSRANLDNATLVELQMLKTELKRVQANKESAIMADNMEDYRKAADLKVRECQLQEQIKSAESICARAELNVEDIARIVEAWTGIPVKKITEDESKKLLSLEDGLHRRIVGQNRAVSAVSQAIRRRRAGLGKRRKPISFIFAGPTGVGKTELVKTIAVELFGSEDALIRLDMSEYMEKHTVSKMIGSPPGYVGYDEGGQLTEKVRRKPYSVILFDEIEKAHPDVYNMLLQILDDGRLTDSQGRIVNFEHSLIIMTTNAGTDMKNAIMGFSDNENAGIQKKVDEALKSIFRPEFLNRIDEIIIFDKLIREELHQIMQLMLSEVVSSLNEKGIKLSIGEKAMDYLVSKGYDEKFGARPLRRALQKYIEDPLAEMELAGEMVSISKIEVDVGEDLLKFHKFHALKV